MALFIFFGFTIVFDAFVLYVLYKDGKRNPRRGKMQDGEYEEFLEWYKNKKK